MRTVEELIEQAKHLKAGELSRLMAKLDDYLSSVSREKRVAKTRPYARTLALAGCAHTDWPGVSSGTGRHIAEAYAARRDG